MRISWLYYFLVSLLLIISGCKDTEPDDMVVLPSNLEVTIEEDSEVTGLYTVEATANNTNFYTITFIDKDEDIVEESSDGKATHQFVEEGEFTVNVKAHATKAEFVEKNEVVTVDFGRTDGVPTGGYSTPESYSGYNLVWQDEFNGTTLSSYWNYEIGTGNSGWGNNELQYYTDKNTTVSGGILTIEARSETFNASSYTSSRITTENNQSFQYGRVDIRAAAPRGKGIWPALWMLGNTFRNDGWPTCGEIDIMEMVGGPNGSKRGDNVAHGTAHWSNIGQHAEAGNSKKLVSGTLADEFHVYSIVWDSQSIKWYFDDTEFHALSISSSELSEFRDKFFLIFNVAVGGNWPGSPDNTTEFPQQLYVDYVRVFQRP